MLIAIITISILYFHFSSISLSLQLLFVISYSLSSHDYGIEFIIIWLHLSKLLNLKDLPCELYLIFILHFHIFITLLTQSINLFTSVSIILLYIVMILLSLYLLTLSTISKVLQNLISIIILFLTLQISFPCYLPTFLPMLTIVFSLQASFSNLQLEYFLTIMVFTLLIIIAIYLHQ